MTIEKFPGPVRAFRRAASLLLAAAALAAAPAAAEPAAEIKRMKSEIEALKKGQDAIRKELAELRKGLQASPARAQPQPFQPVELSIEGAPFRGQPDAPVTLVEFTDYQCPFCRQHSLNTLPEIVKDYVDTGKLRYVIRELPVESRHPLAVKAAEAARCAGDQGKYWEMHDRLFVNQGKFQPEELKAHAQAVGLDAERFAQCLDSGEKTREVRADQSAGLRAGVRGTPAFFLGLSQPGEPGKFRATMSLSGAKSYPEFKVAIDQLLAEAEKGK
jgi:protein-disulfide isomerase